MASNFPAYARLLSRGFEEGTEDAVLRTSMESGPAKQRPRFSRAMEQRSFSFAFDSKTDYLNFMIWVRTTIVLGTAWFNWTDPVDATTKLARIPGGIKALKRQPLNGALQRWTVTLPLEFWGT